MRFSVVWDKTPYGLVNVTIVSDKPDCSVDGGVRMAFYTLKIKPRISSKSVSIVSQNTVTATLNIG
jgi:hypothetical protein